MKWQKAPEELKTILDLAMQGVDCERRLMFGYPAYFINRNMFIGLYQDQLFMRLPEPVVSSLQGKTGSRIRNLEPMPGRPMKDYFVIPRALYMDQAQLRTLMQASLEHARTLKPKETRGARKRAAAAPKAAAKAPSRSKAKLKREEGGPSQRARGKPTDRKP